MLLVHLQIVNEIHNLNYYNELVNQLYNLFFCNPTVVEVDVVEVLTVGVEFDACCPPLILPFIVVIVELLLLFCLTRGTIG